MDNPRPNGNRSGMGHTVPLRLVAVVRAVPPVACAVVAAVGALVLVGWAFDLDLLKTLLHPRAVAMNPATAVCFILTAAALWLLRREPIPRRQRLAAVALALAVAAAGLTRIVGYALDWDFGFDQLLWRSQVGQNVMAPNTATCLLLLGVTLATLDVRTRRLAYHPAQIFALAVACVGLLALTGYAYGSATFYSVGRFIPMALNTAICLFLVSIGIVCARPHRQPLRILTSPTIGGAMVRRLLPWAYIVPLVLGWLRIRGERAGLFDSQFGVSLFAVAIVVVFNLLIWLNARLLHRTDVARQQTEKALRASEAFYHSLVESLPTNIFRKDEAGRFTFANQRFCDILKKPLEEIVGKNDFDLFPHNLAEKYRHDDRAIMESGQTFDEVEEHVTPSGEDLYVHVMKIPLLDPSGRVLGIQGVFWDVTARERAERMLQQTNRQLEQAVQSERQARETLQKTQSTLVQAEKLAGLGQMVAGVAHEINNPLAFVSNNIAVLQRDVKALVELLKAYAEAEPRLKAEVPELWARIDDLSDRIDLPYTMQNLPGLLDRSREGLKRIQQIVGDLRNFARLDESDLHEIDLNDGINSTINIIRGHAKKKGVEIEFERGQLPPVACYPAKLNQVVMNLLSNAIDASPEQGKVTVRTEANNGTIRIEVSDHGHGIPPAIRERIFDPFFTTKPPGEGTGLGLSISYGIIRQHGGTIDVESEPGKGATFTVAIPTTAPASSAS
jgi:PAS domain S-box-containing protein